MVIFGDFFSGEINGSYEAEDAIISRVDRRGSVELLLLCFCCFKRLFQPLSFHETSLVSCKV